MDAPCTSWEPEAPEQRLFHGFLLGLLNLDSGMMSLKLVLMIEFIPVMEPALHGILKEVPVPVPGPWWFLSPFLDHFSYSSTFHVHSCTRAIETKGVSSPQQAVN